MVRQFCLKKSGCFLPEGKEQVHEEEVEMTEEKQGQIMQRTLVVWLGALVCCALWGSAFPCIKIGYRLFAIDAGDTASQILFAGCRFTLAGVLTILIGSILNRRILLPKRESGGKIFKLAMLQTVLQYFFFYVGLANTTGVKASIIEGMNVFVAVLTASLLFRQESLTIQKTIGCVIGFIGVVIVNLNGSMNLTFSLNGEGYIFLSTIAYAFSSVFLKRYSASEDPVVLSGYQFTLGGVIMALVGLVLGGSVKGSGLPAAAMLLYLALVSAVAYSLWGILLKYNPVSRVAVFGFMNPVFGVILSALLLGESAQASGMRSVAALILVCAGIYIVNRPVKEEN